MDNVSDDINNFKEIIIADADKNGKATLYCTIHPKCRLFHDFISDRYWCDKCSHYKRVATAIVKNERIRIRIKKR